MVLILDYGAGNLRSVANAVRKVGGRPTVTSDPAAVRDAEAVILPGVGAAADTMAHLERYGLVEPVKQFIASGRPFLGVCMGLQALLGGSEEGGWHPCLGVVPGKVVKFPSGLIVPHMGWNSIRKVRPHPVLDGIPDESHFYFVHSYYCAPEDPEYVLAVTEYGGDFPAILGRGNWLATQFHPEKSGDVGLRLYANFLEFATLAVPR
jgi:imidazole glycerol-phosphate synthase subunit HisH